MDYDFKELRTKSEYPLLSSDILDQLFERPPQKQGKDGENPSGKPEEKPGKVAESPSTKPLPDYEKPGKVWEAPSSKPEEKPGKVMEYPSSKPHEKPGKVWEAPSSKPEEKPGKVMEAPASKPESKSEFPSPTAEGPARTDEQLRHHLLEQLDRTEMVRTTKHAAKTGDFDSLKNSLRGAFEKCHGDGTKFEKYGRQLAHQLDKENIHVKANQRGFSIHQEGSPYAVEFRVDGNLDFKTGVVRGEVTAQAYDWKTKENVHQISAAEVIKNLRSDRTKSNR